MNKIDCSKTLNYAKEYKRMCDFYDNNGLCEACPMVEEKACHNAEKITQKHIDIVQKWSDEHPQQTMADKFFEIFPNAMKTPTNLPVVCPKYLGWPTELPCPKLYGQQIHCTVCWNRPYSEVAK